MSIKKMLLKNKLLLIVSIIITTLSVIALSPNVLIIPLSVFILFKVLSPIISKKIFDSKFFIFVIVSFCYTILLQCTVLIAWLINSNFPLDFTPLLLLGFLILTYIYNVKILKQKNNILEPGLKTFNIQDILSLTVALLFVAFIALPPLATTTDSNRFSVFLVSNSSNSSDDSSHMAFMNDNIQFNRGVIPKSNAENKTRGTGFYPASWSAISAVFVKTIKSNIQPGKDSLLAYVLLKLFWIFVLCLSITRSSFAVFKFINKDKLRRTSLLSITIISMLFNYLFVIPLSIEGAYSFLPQLISIILSIPLLLQFGFEKSHRSFPLLIIVCIGGCLGWILTLPACFFAIIAIAIYVAADKMAIITLGRIFKMITNCLPLTIIVITAIVIQFLLLTLSKSVGSVSLINGLLIEGGKATHTELYYIFYLIGFISFYVAMDRKESKKLYPILFLVASILCFVTFVYTIQNGIINKNIYYYFKLFDTLLCSIIPICIAGFALIINKFSKDRGRIGEIIFTIIFVFVSMQMLDFNNGYRLYYVAGARPIPNKISKVIIDQLSGDASIKNYFNKEYTFIYTSPNKQIQNRHGSKLIANKPLTECFNNVEGVIYSSSSISTLINAVIKDCDGYKINILTDESSYKNFMQTIKYNKLSDKVNIEVKF